MTLYTLNGYPIDIFQKGENIIVSYEGINIHTIPQDMETLPDPRELFIMSKDPIKRVLDVAKWVETRMMYFEGRDRRYPILF